MSSSSFGHRASSIGGHLLVAITILASLRTGGAFLPGIRGDGEADTCGVGIYILNLGAVDALAGTFEADFYLYITADDANARMQVAQGQSYFPNALKGLTMWEVGKMAGNVNQTIQYRVQSKFYFTVDNSLFPFEKHRLLIVVEDPFKTVEQLTYEANNATSGMSPAIHFPGFAASSMTQSMLVSNFTYLAAPGTEAKTFSRLIFVMDLVRPYGNGIMKGVLPPFFLLLVLSFNTLLPLKHITNRISVAGTILVSAVMYHANLENQTPPTGKLSVADEIMISTYFLITFNFSCAILILLLADHNSLQVASDVQWMCIIVQWACTPLTFVFSLALGQPSFLAVMGFAVLLACAVLFMRQLPSLRHLKKINFGFDTDLEPDVPHDRLLFSGDTPLGYSSGGYMDLPSPGGSVPLQRRNASGFSASGARGSEDAF